MVVFAVLQHGEAFARAATVLGVDVETAIQRQQLMFADASETLAAFMADGQIDSARFESVIRQAVRNLRPLPEHTGGRAYGEMVGLLWTAGKFQQAVELEELWNRLLPSIGLRLFCAYPIDIFGADLHSSPVTAVLHAHTHLLPIGEDGDLERALSRAFSDSRLPMQGVARCPAALRVCFHGHDTECRNNDPLFAERGVGIRRPDCGASPPLLPNRKAFSRSDREQLGWDFVAGRKRQNSICERIGG